jgi:hypothetical protein
MRWVAAHRVSYTKPALNSNVSPFRGTAKAPLIRLTAILYSLDYPDSQWVEAHIRRGWQRWLVVSYRSRMSSWYRLGGK